MDACILDNNVTVGLDIQGITSAWYKLLFHVP